MTEIPVWMRDPFSATTLSILPCGEMWVVVCPDREGRRGWTSDLFPTYEQAEDWLKWRDGKKIADKIEAKRKPSIPIQKEKPPEGIDVDEVLESVEKAARDIEQKAK